MAAGTGSACPQKEAVLSLFSYHLSAGVTIPANRGRVLRARYDPRANLGMAVAFTVIFLMYLVFATVLSFVFKYSLWL
jgi:hypothetical protein